MPASTLQDAVPRGGSQCYQILPNILPSFGYGGVEGEVPGKLYDSEGLCLEFQAQLGSQHIARKQYLKSKYYAGHISQHSVSTAISGDGTQLFPWGGMGLQALHLLLLELPAAWTSLWFHVRPSPSPILPLPEKDHPETLITPEVTVPISWTHKHMSTHMSSNRKTTTLNLILCPKV
jgi:hypothetical protein